MPAIMIRQLDALAKITRRAVRPADRGLLLDQAAMICRLATRHSTARPSERAGGHVNYAGGDMSMTSELPYSSQPERLARAENGERASVAGRILGSVAVLLGSVILGLVGGLAWARLAPHAVYVVVSRGSADVVNPETSAFIAADAAYCLIGIVGGLIIGLAGYLLAVRRYGPWPMAAVGVGSLAAGATARWIGEHQGLTGFDNQLLTSPPGTHLQAPLALAGDTSATTWPTMASLPALAFWPLAACLVAGGLALIVVLRHRSAESLSAALYPALQGPAADQPGAEQPGSSAGP